jgi:diamine N-acetyltransferase
MQNITFTYNTSQLAVMNFVVSGKNIGLRTVLPADEAIIFEWENNPANWLISDTRQPFTRAAIHDFVVGTHNLFINHQLRLMMVELATNRVVGAVDLFEYESYHKRVGVGILVANPSDRKKGWGKESLILAMDYVIKQIGVHQVYCNILTSNTKSIQLFESCGFELIGVKKSWIRSGATFLDEAMYQFVK